MYEVSQEWSIFIDVLSGYYYFCLLILKKTAFNDTCYAFNFEFHVFVNSIKPYIKYKVAAF